MASIKIKLKRKIETLKSIKHYLVEDSKIYNVSEGLCDYAYRLCYSNILKNKEDKWFEEYIFNQTDTQYPERTKGYLFDRHRDDGGFKLRLKWLEKHIKLLQEQDLNLLQKWFGKHYLGAILIIFVVYLIIQLFLIID